MSEHVGVSVDGDGVTAVVVREGLVGAPAPSVSAQCDAGDPDALALTVSRLLAGLGWWDHAGGQLTVAVPAGWEPRRSAALREALGRFGLGGTGTTLVTRSAAALRTASRRRPGRALVIDIGRLGTELSTVDAGGEPRITGSGPADLGAAELDWVVLGHVLDELVGSLPERVDRHDLAARCRAARHELTRTEIAEIEVPVVGGTEQVRISRAQFEDAVREPVLELVDRVARALAGRRGEGVRLVVVAGDGADLPLLERVLTARLGARRWTAPGPAAVATGAAYLAADRARDLVRPAPGRRVPGGARVAAAAAAAVVTLAGGALAGGW